MDYKEFCLAEYEMIYEREFAKSKIKNKEDKRRDIQKAAIIQSSINAFKMYPNVNPSEIWKTIYVAHIHKFSGLENDSIINAVISADQSWKKSSGHAFEQMVKDLSNLSLASRSLEVILQKDLSILLNENKILNEVRDISWLREQVRSSVFDLYISIKREDGYLIFGCIQSKTSIRDRVSRDREPSTNAMKAFFWSVAVVLDGDFLKLPKFKSMVNGNSADYSDNGWHSMYVFSTDNFEEDRIKSINISMDGFINEAVLASEFWLNQRQWFDHNWRP